MASAKGKSQLFKFKELPPYPTLLAEEMAEQTFILVYTVGRWLNSSMFWIDRGLQNYFCAR